MLMGNALEMNVCPKVRLKVFRLKVEGIRTEVKGLRIEEKA